MKLLPIKPAPPVTSTFTMVSGMLSVRRAAECTEDVRHVADARQRHRHMEPPVLAHRRARPKAAEVERLIFRGEAAALRIVIARHPLLQDVPPPDVPVE